MSHINTKLTAYILGLLLFVEAGFLSLSLLVSLIYQEKDILAFISSILIAIILGGILVLYGRNYVKEMSKREGFLIVTSSWIIFSLIGSI
ncbi:MAG: TrkH family potassium uptake protein, partial [Bacteroidales bacterium]